MPTPPIAIEMRESLWYPAAKKEKDTEMFFGYHSSLSKVIP